MVKTGPLNSFNQYDYAIISNWVRFPVVVLARDPERFQREHMRDVLEYLERRGMTKVQVWYDISTKVQVWYDISTKVRVWYDISTKVQVWYDISTKVRVWYYIQ